MTVAPDCCTLCPRQCGADRTSTQGLCGGGAQLRVARAALHAWEEPCISGRRGSGTVFFSGCPLRCCFCQNHPISAGNFGKEISVELLADIFLELQAQGAHNINLVNPTHWMPWIVKALEAARSALQIPVVYNTGGYELTQSLRRLEGLVDVYLTDVKFFDAALAGRYAHAPDYFFYAAQAVVEMQRQTGAPVFDADGMLRSGVIVRHLVLPKAWRDSCLILDWLAKAFHPEQLLLSLMRQYTPAHHCADFPEINRRLSSYEYRNVLERAVELGFGGYMQEKNEGAEEYTPAFDLSGI